MKKLTLLVVLLGFAVMVLPRSAQACFWCDYRGNGNVFSQCAWGWSGGSTCVDQGGNGGPWVCAVSGSCSWGWIDPNAFTTPRLKPLGYVPDLEGERMVEVCLNSPGCRYWTDAPTERAVFTRLGRPWGTMRLARIAYL